ncbi:MAG TPA: DUF4082 domain-containing protein, partial [Polyangiaceae bacterium]|nr:DUF4082 domain-containing protein [Polyangiaceae bacterium]
MTRSRLPFTALGWTLGALGALGCSAEPSGTEHSVESLAADEVSLWPDTTRPAVVSDTDPAAVELGVKFRSDVDGSVRGIRFYKGPNNAGVHVGNLWSSSGSLLSSVRFENETASGWQTARLANPISVRANTTYVVSYHAPNGSYSANNAYFVTGRDVAPLHALRDGQDGGNGVYRYGSSGFPDSTYRSSNYWVDVVFSSAATPSTGGGLTAEYFDNSDFTNLELTRADPTLNFNWAAGSPSSALGADSFSVRWTGKVTPRYSESYTFSSVSDDGVRLWVNGQQIIDNWTLHAPTTNSGSITLTQGQAYDLKLEYFENTGGATLQLFWQSTRQAREIVPQAQLTPGASAPPPPPPPPP